MSALGFLLLAAFLNVVLDLVFVANFNMGVPGVALATILSQAISAVFCFMKLMKMGEHFDMNKSTLKLRKEVAMRIIGLPPIGNLFYIVLHRLSAVKKGNFWKEFSLTNSAVLG